MYNFYNLYGCGIPLNDGLQLHYWCTLEQILTSMFKYEALPAGLNKKYIEHTLIRFGCACIVKIESDYFVRVPAIQPPLDNYGIGTEIVVTTYNGMHQIKGKLGANAVLIWNNTEFTGDFIISWYAKMFKEIDVSMEANVFNSRLHPIPVARNSKIKSAIDNIFKSIKGETKNNDTYSILSDTAFAEEINGTASKIDVLNLTDVKDVDKLQYLSKFHDDLLRRFCTLYGQAMQTTGKMAQQTVEEIQGYDSFSMIIPSNRLEERQKGITEFNRIFGENVTVEYNEAWQDSLFKKEVISNETGDNDED